VLNAWFPSNLATSRSALPSKVLVELVSRLELEGLKQEEWPKGTYVATLRDVMEVGWLVALV